MTEKPILFNAEMVRAVLSGNKTQTRRMIKVQPSSDNHQMATCIDTTGSKKTVGKHHWIEVDGSNVKSDDGVYFSSPFGYKGDQLWVRENFQPLLADDKTWDDMPYTNYKTGEGYKVSYPATDGIIEFVNADDEIKDTITPSIHMPRWASRIQLEITNIRVERLQDISVEDAISEGCKGGHGSIVDYGYNASPDEHFMSIWSKTYGEHSWHSNPWVWVIEFKKINP